MTPANEQTLITWQRATVTVCAAASVLGTIAISPTVRPAQLMEDEGFYWALRWIPFLLVAFAWLLDFAWRAAAVVWLHTATSASAIAVSIVILASAAIHFASDTSRDKIISVGCLIAMPFAILFTWGFYKRRDWARKTILRLAQFGVVATIAFGFLSRIGASEMWSTLACAVSWYWFTRPSVVQAFVPKAEAA